MSADRPSGFNRFLKGCAIFAGLALLGLLVIAGIGGYFVYKGVEELKDNPGYVPPAGAQCTYDPVAGDAALAVVLPGQLELGYPTESYDRLYVRTYVKDGLFDYLDTLLTTYADSVRRDFRLEYRMFDLYHAFMVGDTTLEPFLDTWVTERPQSSNARLVRAAWHLGAGMDARGGAYVADTPDSNMASLNGHLDRVMEDLKAAHALDPCSIVTYELLIRASAYRGNRYLSRKLLDQGLKIQPYSFLLRARHMYNLLPRWGGSYRAMEEFAAESDSLIPRNPRLRSLYGFALSDRADLSGDAEDTLRAIAQHDSALAYGEFWEFRMERGILMYQIDNHQSALDDLERALVQRPQHPTVLRYLARVSYEIGRTTPAERDQRYRDAFRYIDLAIAIDPNEADSRRSRDFYVRNIPRYAPPPPGG